MYRLLSLIPLLILTSPATAGWYRVTNYTGHLGDAAVHLSLQVYSFGSGLNVEGSYYYDRYRSPIVLYGKLDGDQLALCEIHDTRTFSRIIEQGSKSGFDTTACPLQLTLTGQGANGKWHDRHHTLAVNLSRAGQLNDDHPAHGSAELKIPFWGQTAYHTFVGLYRTEQGNVSIDRVDVISKASGKVVQRFNPNAHECGFGFTMTPIYMNLQTASPRGPEQIVLTCYSQRGDRSAIYTFNPDSGRFVFTPPGA
ncbi:hypothetical protein A11A3_08025 [Alcanivorax hongdengensis A-11-3]|uniref:Uncharacterized protein n=1 Tax=Alcanivorax hongdengensis A-11-3 TaxID=1177179 RepID=L0WCU0_9GAMM|nr:hypothetical protein [Alcanivorax hongdengensis]EKF74558.1 hypothetical protein A11A3_08025 [Alcanivorax hongdengensis A-11-3]